MQRATLALLASLAALWPLALPAEAQSPTPTVVYHIAVIFGPSNIVGQAPLPIPASTPHPRVQNFANDYAWHPSFVEPWDCALTACGLLCNQSSCPHGCITPGCSDLVDDSDGTPMYSPAQRLAGDLANANPSWGPVGMMSVALGASTLCQWRPGAPGYNPDGTCVVINNPNINDRSTLFGALKTRVNTAEARGTLTFIAMTGGEVDAMVLSEASQVAVNQQDLIGDLRTLGTDVPLCFQQIGNISTAPGNFPYRDLARNGQQLVADLHMPNVGMVITSQYGCQAAGVPADTADGCHCTGFHTGTSQCDIPIIGGVPTNNHFSFAGQNTLADRFAECFAALNSTPSPTPTVQPTPTPHSTRVPFSCPGGPA